MSSIVGFADINFAANFAHLKRAALVTDEIRLTMTVLGGSGMGAYEPSSQ
jgi:hypothetical protein